MSTQSMKTNSMVNVCSLEDLALAGPKVISIGGRAIVLFLDEGRVYALDNRCPHMGFPLHKGTVKSGVLTCHWHHAKFDLAGGCTFDPFADDVTPFRTQVVDGQVLVDPQPMEGDRSAHWQSKMDEGLRQQIPLVLAKSVIGLDSLGETTDILKRAALFPTCCHTWRWRIGLSLSTMA
ncbi:MAG: Rieske (2Fe-2S) protein [Dehalococcoidia bacterium]|nr:Rieske (2Fe-2S) protein [Dehalococcoidia bacterium]